MFGIVSKVPQSDKYFARIVVGLTTFQLLEVYEGEEGKQYWIDRFRKAGIEHRVED